jgi:hypothetical protein
MYTIYGLLYTVFGLGVRHTGWLFGLRVEITVRILDFSTGACTFNQFMSTV